MEPSIQQLCTDLEQAIENVVDNYTHGHEIPLSIIVGTLHIIAYKYTMEVIEVTREELQDDDDDDDNE